MTDYLLKGLKEIHEELYTGKDGKPVMRFQAFKRRKVISEGKKRRMIDDMKRLGILFRMVFGRPGQRKSVLCGWRGEIKNYMRALYQEEYEEKNPPQA